MINYKELLDTLKKEGRAAAKEKFGDESDGEDSSPITVSYERARSDSDLHRKGKGKGKGKGKDQHQEYSSKSKKKRPPAWC